MMSKRTATKKSRFEDLTVEAWRSCVIERSIQIEEFAYELRAAGIDRATIAQILRGETKD